jgi:hypothetical protein
VATQQRQLGRSRHRVGHAAVFRVAFPRNDRHIGESLRRQQGLWYGAGVGGSPQERQSAASIALASTVAHREGFEFPEAPVAQCVDFLAHIGGLMLPRPGLSHSPCTWKSSAVFGPRFSKTIEIFIEDDVPAASARTRPPRRQIRHSQRPVARLRSSDSVPAGSSPWQHESPQDNHRDHSSFSGRSNVIPRGRSATPERHTRSHVDVGLPHFAQLYNSNHGYMTELRKQWQVGHCVDPGRCPHSSTAPLQGSTLHICAVCLDPRHRAQDCSVGASRANFPMDHEIYPINDIGPRRRRPTQAPSTGGSAGSGVSRLPAPPPAPLAAPGAHCRDVWE